MLTKISKRAFINYANIRFVEFNSKKLNLNSKVEEIEFENIMKAFSSQLVG